MAEGSSVLNQDDVVCRFFLYSSCKEGDRCPFSHDTSRRTPDSVCRYYLQGKCQFGDHCRFDHIPMKDGENFKQRYRSDRHSAGSSRQQFECRNSHAARPDSNKKDAYQPRYSFLHRNAFKNDVSNSGMSGPHSSNWVNAPEFVPKTVRSYADTVKSTIFTNPEPDKMHSEELCAAFMEDACPFNDQCPFVHGNVCELCSKACLHPYDEKQRKEHTEQCEKELEQDMELAFAVQRSIDKTCGICMDVIMEKDPISERRFGILEKCNHVFCLSCIRKWRRSKEFGSNQHIDSVLDPVVTRACPECRVASDFITPSLYWVDTEEEKKKLITEYKGALSKKPCKYFKQGEGTCPFGGACFYLHAKPDGTKVELPPPTRRRRQNQDGELDYMGRIFLWDYLEFREENILLHLDIDDHLVYTWSESDDDASDVSDNFFLSESF
ncbi:probable E3 ubiquitin-protein ligase makorin-1 [Uloborus diversus]|uniref:probable E3 ubiquitin-protein ligase makorin-1 n=1 Tax=Uloborus diversus TaxID=327109 RepID=UPI002409CDA7|nr:probable E3 ubiquitin-protein ligase makorin-1 [Uloborus diversus]